MTATIITLLLDRELQKINRTIDSKIAAGKSYRKEAQLHKKIVTRLNKLKTQKSVLAML